MNGVSMRVRSSSGRSALLISMLVLLGISSAAQAVDNVQSGYASAEAGDWGGQNGAVIGAPDGTCANMGAVGKVNLVSGFDFNLPSNATVTGITAFAKAGENGPQSVDVRIATNATVDPPNTVGNALVLSVPGTGGACSDTAEIQIGTTLGSWGIGALTYLQVNSPNFGMVFVKTEASSIKVDSVCMNVAYTTPEGSAVVEDCFEEPPPLDANQITVVKDLDGAVPGSDWEFDPDWDDSFTIPAVGGAHPPFGDLTDGLYTITETPKEGYTVSVQCLEGETVVASGTNSVVVDLDNADQRDDFAVTCIFTNTEILPPPPPPPITRATFQVTKDFTDDNPRTANVTISCDTGLPLTQSWDVSEAAGVTFVVESFASGAMRCDVTEAAVPGYTTVDAVAGGKGTGTPSDTATKCTFSSVGDGDAWTCVITNEPTPVQVTVFKDWVIDGQGGNQINPYYCITLDCGSSEIIGGDEDDDDWTRELYCGASNGTEDFPYTAHVVPNWQGNTFCRANETVVVDNAIDSVNGCADKAALNPVIGGGGSKNACTITNTVFFEGIPTLSQYGMVIMALLMLGVGFVGFRRFV